MSDDDVIQAMCIICLNLMPITDLNDACICGKCVERSEKIDVPFERKEKKKKGKK